MAWYSYCVGRNDMIKQTIDVNGYWTVMVYYDINYNRFYNIVDDLIAINIPAKTIKQIYRNIVTHRAKAVTISNIEKQISIVVFNRHNDNYDYINSIVHEAEHIKQAMLKGYKIKDKGEPPAYTVGYLVMKMMMFLDILK